MVQDHGLARPGSAKLGSARQSLKYKNKPRYAESPYPFPLTPYTILTLNSHTPCYPKGSADFQGMRLTRSKSFINVSTIIYICINNRVQTAAPPPSALGSERGRLPPLPRAFPPFPPDLKYCAPPSAPRRRLRRRPPPVCVCVCLFVFVCLFDCSFACLCVSGCGGRRRPLPWGRGGGAGVLTVRGGRRRPLP